MSESGRSTSLKLFVQRISLMWVTNFLIAVSGIVVLPVITRNLTLSDYGSWNLITLTLSLVSIGATLSLNMAIYRFFPAATAEHKRDLIWSITTLVVALSIVGSAVIFIMYLAGIGRSFLLGPEIVALVMVTIPVYCLVTMIPAYFIAMKQMRLYSILIIAQAYGDLLLYMYFIRYGVTGLVLSILIMRIALLIIMLFFIVRAFGVQLPRFLRFREIVRYNAPLFSTKITSWIVESSDRYVIALFLTEKSVGLYSPGYTLGTMMYMIVSPLESVLTVTITELFEAGRLAEMRKYLEYSLKYMLLFTIPAFMGLSLLAWQILVYLTTDEIASVSYQITAFTALSTMLLALCVVPSQILLLYKETHVIGTAWAAAAIVNLLLNFITVPLVGIIGAAITTLIAYAIIFIIVTRVAYRKFPFAVDWAFVAKCVLASAIMAGLLAYFDPRSLLAVLASVPAGIVVFFTLMFLLGAFRKDELKFLYGMVRL